MFSGTQLSSSSMEQSIGSNSHFNLDSLIGASPKTPLMLAALDGIRHYNGERAHNALGYLSPMEFAALASMADCPAKLN